MEPRREEQEALPPGAEQKPRRFRIIKLEERIAPKKGGKGTNKYCSAVCDVPLTCDCAW